MLNLMRKIKSKWNCFLLKCLYPPSRNGIYLNEIFTHLTDMEKRKLLNLSRKVRGVNSIAVEIGSYLGASSCFIAEGLKSGKVYCIDTWQNVGMSEGFRDTYMEFMRNTENYKDKIVAIRGWSFDVFDRIASLNQTIDLLFVDGDHSYEGVKKDWNLYSPFLKKGSIVIFHDSGWAEGVQKVIRDDVFPVVKKYASLPNMWWGWIR